MEGRRERGLRKQGREEEREIGAGKGTGYRESGGGRKRMREEKEEGKAKAGAGDRSGSASDQKKEIKQTCKSHNWTGEELMGKIINPMPYQN